MESKFRSYIYIYTKVAQLVEQWTENPRVSSSVLLLGTMAVSSKGQDYGFSSHPLGFESPLRYHGHVVQLVRTSACHVEGRGFDSHRVRFLGN